MTTDSPVAIITVNFHSAALLASKFYDLPASACIIVVDNSVKTDEKEATRTLCSDRGWSYIDARGNIGFGAACNLGADEALRRGAQVLAFINPDATIEGAAVGRMADAVAATPEPALLSPVIEDNRGLVWFAGAALEAWRADARHSHDPQHRENPDWITGACLFASAGTWRTLGGFAEHFFLYWEDVELSQRCLSLGGSLLVVSDVTAHHDVGGTQQAQGKSATYVKYVVRNRLLFARRHLGALERAYWVIMTPTQLLRLARLSGVRRGYIGKLAFVRACTWGIRHGVADVA